MKWLTADRLDRTQTSAGVQASLVFEEANGDRHHVHCLCHEDYTTDIGDEEGGTIIDYLNGRYGSQVVCALARFVTMRPENFD